jgi:hypothetical protein
MSTNWYFEANARKGNEKYQPDFIYLYLFQYEKNGKTYSTGVLHSKLRKELEISPGAMAAFQNYQKNDRIFWGNYAVGLGAFVASRVVDSEKLQNGLLLGSAGALLVSIPFAIKSHKPIAQGCPDKK